MAAADIPVHRSRLAQQIEQLTPRQQYDLGLPEALLPLWSLLVRLCHDLTDGRDTRSFDQRRDGALARLSATLPAPAPAATTARSSSTSSPTSAA